MVDNWTLMLMASTVSMVKMNELMNEQFTHYSSKAKGQQVDSYEYRALNYAHVCDHTQ